MNVDNLLHHCYEIIIVMSMTRLCGHDHIGYYYIIATYWMLITMITVPYT